MIWFYDCFNGSGTTSEASIKTNRNWIGSEISFEYCNIIEERIKKALEEKRKEKDLTQKTLFGDRM
jgi:DNA modification methylase